MTQRIEAVPDPRLPQFEVSVRPEWIDTNNHVNAAYYLSVVKDPALYAHDLWDYGTAFRQRTGESNFVTEAEVIYMRELLMGSRIVVTTRIVELDDKRARILFEIFNRDEKYLAALAQYLVLHVRLGPPPKAANIPGDLKERLVHELARHREVPMPSGTEKLRSLGSLAQHGR